MSGIGTRAGGGGSFLPDKSARRSHCSFDKPSLHRARGEHPTQLADLLKVFPVAFPCERPVLAHTSDFPNISQTSSTWPQRAVPLAKWQPAVFCSLASSGHPQAQRKYQLSADGFVTLWPWAEHRQGLVLACTSQKVPEPVHPVDSFRPRRSTKQPPPQGTY